MSDEIQSGTGAIVAKGVTGVVTPFCGLIVSSLPAIEAWLRVASLSVGVAVGLVTLVSIVRKKK